MLTVYLRKLTAKQMNPCQIFMQNMTLVNPKLSSFCNGFGTIILGDPGAVSGGGEKSSGRGKNSGEEKSRRRIRAPGDKDLTDQFQTVGAILVSDWCQKIFVFFCPITEQEH